MADQKAPPAGPDLSQGVTLPEFSGAMLLGHVGDDEVLLVRSGSEIFAIDAHCSHYHGPLAEGLVDRRKRSLSLASRLFRSAHRRSGPRAGAHPACGLEGRARGRPHLCPRKARAAEAARKKAAADAPDKIVIVGGGAAGFAAAEMLRRLDYRGSIVMLSNDDARAGRSAQPVEGLSRRQRARGLAAAATGSVSMPKPQSICGSRTEVTSIDAAGGKSILGGGKTVPYDRLLLATGAEPVRLPIPGADQPHVHVLRSLADCRAIIALGRGTRAARS